MRERSRAVSGSRDLGGGFVFAIAPVEFSAVGFFRRDLEPYHVNWWLNQFSKYYDGVLVSSRFMTENRLRLGDTITMVMPNRPRVDVRIVGELNYWPSVDVTQDYFFVMALPYLNDEVGLVPYQVWLRTDPDASSGRIMQTLADRDVHVTQLYDARAQIAAERREPSRTGLFGLLSGLFYIRRPHCRRFPAGYHSGASETGGPVRCPPCHRPFCEPTGCHAVRGTVAADGRRCGLGSLLGNVTTRLFVPSLQGATHRFGQVPPFRIVEEAVDFVRMYGVLALVLVAALGLTTWAVRKMRMDEAIKLGEEH